MEPSATRVAQRPASFRYLLTQRGPSTTVIVATLITFAAVAPLAWLAWDARGDDPAEGTGLMAVVGGASVSLAGLDTQPGAMEALVVDDESFVAVAWALYVADGELVADGETTGPAPFTIAADVSSLDGGVYDFLISATERDGSTVQRAARFRVSDTP